MESIKKYVTRGDIIVIAVLAGLALLLFVLSLTTSCGGGDDRYAVVRRDGTELYRLSLLTDTAVNVECDDRQYCTVTIKDGAVCISDAACPDRLCVNQGCISRCGQVIVCLPNRLTVSIEDGNHAAPDAVAY